MGQGRQVLRRQAGIIPLHLRVPCLWTTILPVTLRRLPMRILRRDVLRLSACLAALPVASRPACADTYPSRPIRVLVATSAGGSTDIIGRLVAQYLTEKLGQPFFVENRPGGGNNIGTEMAAHAPPDGYTLF